MDSEGILWILERIDLCDHRRYRPTKRAIFQGSYDVWHDEDDRKMQIQIMTDRLQYAKDRGFIIDETDSEYPNIVLWKITPAGKALQYEKRIS